MRGRFAIAILGAVGIAWSCSGDNGMAPRANDPTGSAAQTMDQIADSMSDVQPPDDSGAAVLRHIAKVLRLAGSATPISITVDGMAGQYLAVAEQVDVPGSVCSGGSPGGDTLLTDSVPPDSSHHPVPPDSSSHPVCPPVSVVPVRGLIAWDASLTHIIRLVADTGSGAVSSSVPDPMQGMPKHASASDTSHGGTGGVGGRFFGEYIVRGQGHWVASAGTEQNQLVSLGGACTSDSVTTDQSTWSCQRATMQFELAMTVQSPFATTQSRRSAVARASDTTLAPSQHTLAMSSTTVAGIRLLFGHGVGTRPPDSLPHDTTSPPPPPDTLPNDTLHRDTLHNDSLTSYLVALLDSSSTTGAFRFHFVVTNQTGHVVNIDYPTGQSFDVQVKNSAGAVVWTWSETRDFPTTPHRDVLASGQALTFDAEWEPTVHGALSSAARLTSSDEPVQARTTFSVP